MTARAISIDTQQIVRLPARIGGRRVHSSTHAGSYPDDWVPYGGCDPIPDGYRAIDWTTDVRDGVGYRVPVLEERDVDAETLARIEPYVATVLAALELACDAGYATPPVDNEDALAQGMERIGTAGLAETQAGLLLKQARDALAPVGITWADVLWFAAYAADHPEILE